MEKGKRIIKSRLRSFRHAGKGLKLLLRERNARVHIAAGMPQQDKDIKDLAAGAVLPSAMTAAAIGMIVLSC